MNISHEDMAHIRTSMDRLSADELASEIGLTKHFVEKKIRELKLIERIRNLAYSY